MKKYILSIIISVITIALAIIAWIILPNEVAVQIGLDGKVSNTMPKIFALAIPFIVSVIGVVLTLINKQDKNEKNNVKGLVVSIIGIAIMILTLVFNL